MATTNRNNSSSAGEKKPAAKKRTTSNQRETKGNRRKTYKESSSYEKLTQEEIAQQSAFHDEITLVVTLVSAILVILANFGMGGFIGGIVNRFLLGIFGTVAYLIPFATFIVVAFHISNRGNRRATRKIITGAVLIVAIMAFLQMISKQYDLRVLEFYTYGKSISLTKGVSGGLIGGIICKILTPLVGKVGAYVIIIAIFLVGFMIFTGKTLVTAFSKKSGRLLHDMKSQYQENASLRQEYYQKRIEEQESFRGTQDQKDTTVKKRKAKIFDLKARNYEVDSATGEIKGEPLNEANVTSTSGMESRTSVDMEEIQPDMQKLKISGDYISTDDFPSYENELKQKFGNSAYEGQSEELEFNLGYQIEGMMQEEKPEIESKRMKDQQDSKVKAEPAREANVHIQEVTVPQFMNDNTSHEEDVVGSDSFGYESDLNYEAGNDMQEFGYETYVDEISQDEVPSSAEHLTASTKHQNNHSTHTNSHKSLSNDEGQVVTTEDIANEIQKVEEKPYVFPPLNLLAKPRKNVKGMTDHDLKETASKLQKTLESFGVRATITNVTCGPAVTRYEIQPEQGVKVSTITKLSDDIKLNLAATDIRIEAPIPGKAAVGIEVPNKENSAVMFRELIENKDFMEHPSDIAFAVGKDISGQSIITDIGKMPHLLIAGATGSGKSVCINTLIMSILYKADPKDVKLIMVDPKVVELSIYNGIPHLMIPVVTDPKKASAALNWAVVEMNERYKRFADVGVRDIKSYNAKIKQVEYLNDERYKKMPQIVIIVDELADLMMVAKGEVEEAICRLAQMARAAGLHLVIATQRPSVNVITGLIKANVPSRIAFAVSSAVDSRTIIDGSGAEKLLGKGDMLFFPQGYPKPVRLQGAFISDKEVSSVVEFLSRENGSATYSDAVEAHISGGGVEESATRSGASDRDDYFVQAGKYIIEKDKASIGMLQRVYKIGFNRAARIMDQLCEAGVVGPEEGTKPRKVLMSMEEFDQYIDEYV